MRRVVFAVAVFVVASCGGGSKGPTAPSGPTYPNIGGTYTSASFWSYRFTNVATGQNVTIVCPGSATFRQSGSTFSGSFIMQAGGSGCDPSSGEIRSGQVATDGGVSFDLFIPGSDPNSLQALTGCRVISGDSLLRGSVSGNFLDAAATAGLDCPGARLSVTMRTSGTR